MAYKTRYGQRIKMPRSSTNGVQYLEKIDGTKATFICREGGHRTTIDYSKGPISRRMSAAALKRFSTYWGMKQPDGTRRGHAYGWCQKCQNEWDRQDPRNQVR